MPKQTPNTRKAAKSTSKAGEANAAAKQQKETEAKETAKTVSQEEEEEANDPEPNTKPTSSSKTRPSKEHEKANKSDRNKEADMTDLEVDEEGTAFITSHWDGALPIAEGIVAKHFKRNSITEPCRQAEALLDVLESGDGAKVQLDQTNWTPFL